MDIDKKNEIEAQLRKLLEMSSREQELSTGQTGGHCTPCNVIRRRKGEADKRLFVMR